jgi:transcriptional regulator with XRE-family HTH domain
VHTKISNMNKSDILIKFGLRLKEVRKANGLSQEKLAEIANLHRTYIGMIERAEKNITLINIEKIALALNVEIKDLL